MFSASGDGFVRQHATNNEKVVREYKGRDWVYAIDYHPGTQRVASGSYDGKVGYKYKTGEAVKAFKASPGYCGRHHIFGRDSGGEDSTVSTRIVQTFKSEIIFRNRYLHKGGSMPHGWYLYQE